MKLPTARELFKQKDKFKKQIEKQKEEMWLNAIYSSAQAGNTFVIVQGLSQEFKNKLTKRGYNLTSSGSHTKINWTK